MFAYDIMSFKVLYDADSLVIDTTEKELIILRNYCIGRGEFKVQRQPHPGTFLAESSETLLVEHRFFLEFSVFRTSRKAMLTLPRAVSLLASIQQFLAGIKNLPP